MGTKATADAYCRHIHGDEVEAVSWQTMDIDSFEQKSQIETSRPLNFGVNDCNCPDLFSQEHPCTNNQSGDHCVESYITGTGSADNPEYVCPSYCVYTPTSDSSAFYCPNADNCPYSEVMDDHPYDLQGWNIISHRDKSSLSNQVIYNLQCGSPLCGKNCTDGGFDNNQSNETYGLEITTANRYCFELGYENAISWELSEELFSSTSYYCRQGGFDCIDNPNGGWFYNNNPYNPNSLDFRNSIINLQCGYSLAACNYDSSAIVDDGSCDYSCHDPMDNNAFRIYFT